MIYFPERQLASPSSTLRQAPSFVKSSELTSQLSQRHKIYNTPPAPYFLPLPTSPQHISGHLALVNLSTNIQLLPAFFQ